MEENIIYEPGHYIAPDIIKNQNMKLDFSVRDEIIDKFFDNFYRKLEEYLVENLSKIGFTFNSKDEFYEFCKVRISKIDFGENDHEFYLDFIDLQNKGVLVGKYSDNSKIEFNNEGMTLTIY